MIEQGLRAIKRETMLVLGALGGNLSFGI